MQFSHLEFWTLVFWHSGYGLAVGIGFVIDRNFALEVIYLAVWTILNLNFCIFELFGDFVNFLIDVLANVVFELEFLYICSVAELNFIAEFDDYFGRF